MFFFGDTVRKIPYGDRKDYNPELVVDSRDSIVASWDN